MALRTALLMFTAFAAALVAKPAFAACTLSFSSATFQTGEMVYNDDHSVLQVCDGANWRAAIGGGSTVPTLFNLPDTDIAGPLDAQVLTYDSASGRWVAGTGIAGGGDDLGSHIATQNIETNGFWLSRDGDSEGVFVDAAGNVGIGTASPADKLRVSGNVAVVGDLPANVWGQVIGLGSSGTGGTTQGIIGHQGSHALNLYWNFHRNSTAFAGLNANGFTSANGITMGDAGILFSATETMTTSFPTTRMSINNDGNVGIGTQSPSSKLEVAGWLKIDDPALTDDELSLETQSGFHRIAAHQLRIYEWGGPGDVLWVDGGNVGVGVAPTFDLDVLGDIRLTGDIYDQGGQQILEADTADGWLRINEGPNSQIAFHGWGAFGSGGVYVGAWLNAGTGNIRATGNVIADGNVGIGTPSPADKLHIQDGSMRMVGASWRWLSMDGGNKTLRMHYGDPTNELRFGRYGAGFGAWEANPYVFDMDAPSTTLFANGAGNVGIGISPAQKFHVNGNIRLDGNAGLYFGATQRFDGDQNNNMNLYSNHSTITALVMRDAQGTIYGRLYGDSDGANFGLLDADGQWSYFAMKDNQTQFRINNVAEMILTPSTLDLNANTISDVSAYLHSSDARLKTEITTIDQPLRILNGLRGVHYKWKRDNKPAFGVIAQEVEVVMPDAVETDEDGFKSVDYDQIIGPLIEAVKAQQNQIESLQIRVHELEKGR